MLKYPDCKQTGLELILSPKTNKQIPVTLWSTVTANTVWEYLFKTELERKSPPAGCWLKTPPPTAPDRLLQLLRWKKFFCGAGFDKATGFPCVFRCSVTSHQNVKAPPPYLKKGAIRCANSEVWVSFTVTPPGQVGLETRPLVEQNGNTGFPPSAHGARWTRPTDQGKKASLRWITKVVLGVLLE